jgi:hypothetical protein
VTDGTRFSSESIGRTEVRWPVASADRLVIAWPVPPGRSEAWRRLAQEVAGSRSQLHRESRRQRRIVREHWWIVLGPVGELAVLCLETPDRSLEGWTDGGLEHDRWLCQRINNVLGLDLATYPSDRHQELLFDWHEAPGGIPSA